MTKKPDFNPPRSEERLKKFKRQCFLLFWWVMGLSMPVIAQSGTERVTLNLTNATMETFVDQVTVQTGYKFFYGGDMAEGIEPITINVQGVALKAVLDEVLGKKGYSYTLEDKTVVIQEAQKKLPQVKQIPVKGRVVDEKGNPLPGVTVMLKGTMLGTATDLDGNYNLTLPGNAPKSALVFSFIGMETQEIAWQGQQQTINVTMVTDATEMDEVVVTGMFTRRKESFTGSSQTFSSAELRQVGNQNLLKSLKNLDPSFKIMENLEFGSDPNRLPDVQMRGATSFRSEYEGNPNQPLFILDGFETTLEKVFDLDMNRVESVTLLKDAAAKAIYGSKAGNGVVVIQTIRPLPGELRVSYSGDYGIEAPDLTGYNLMNAKEKLAYEVGINMYGPNLSGDNSFLPAGTITEYAAYQAVYNDVARGVDTYWLSQPLRTGFSHKHALNLEGGDSRMRYSAGLSYNKTAGVMKGSERNTLNLNTTLSYTYNNLIFRNTIEFTRNWSKNSPYGSFDEYIGLNPYWAPYDEDGNLVKEFTLYHYGSSERIANPLYNGSLNTKDESAYTEVLDNFAVDWNISPAFRATGSFSYRRQESSSDVFYPTNHTMFAEYDENGQSARKGQYTKTNGYTDYVSAQVGLNFNKTLGRHLIFTNVTWNMTTNSSNSTSVIAEGFGNDFMDDISFGAQYMENTKPSGSNSKSREVGVIAALNYSFADRYLFDASIRFSGSSAYGQDNPWGSFWSLGAGWNLHHENFLEGNEWITYLKLRGSLGYTGTQNVDPSQARARYEYSDYVYGDKLGASLIALPNTELQWQRVMDYNVGLDLSLKDFLNIRAEYYIQDTDNLLSDISLPPSTGFTTYKENLGKIKNTGYELSLSVTPWRSPKNQGYVTLSFNATHNKNEIVDIADIFKNSNDEQNANLDADGTEDSAEYNEDFNLEDYVDRYTEQLTKPATLYYEGCSMTAIWGMRSLGVDPASGREMYLTKDGKSTFDWSSAEQVVIGDTEPKLEGTFGVSAGYKGFSLSLSASYKFGGDLYNSDLIARMENITGYENLDRRVWDSWLEPGDVAPYRSLLINGPSTGTAFTKPTSRFVQKNNELYISSINLGYEFDGNWMKKLSLERLKLSFYMNELVRISSIQIERGTSYPFARNFSFSLQATF